MALNERKRDFSWRIIKFLSSGFSFHLNIFGFNCSVSFCSLNETWLWRKMSNSTMTMCRHRDRTRASNLCCFGLFFFLIWTCKKPADYGPQQHQRLFIKVWFSHIWLWIILSGSCFYCKKTNFNIKTVSLLCVKTKSGAHKHPT